MNKIKEPAYEPEHGRNEQERYDSWGEERRSILLLVMQILIEGCTELLILAGSCTIVVSGCGKMYIVVPNLYALGR